MADESSPEAPTTPTPPDGASTTPAGAEPATAERPAPTTDLRRLVVPVLVLLAVAVAAMTLGLRQRSSSDNAAATSTPGTAAAPWATWQPGTDGAAAPPTTAAAPAPGARPASGPASTATASTAEPGGSGCGRWPEPFHQAPADPSAPGVYIWADNGWHLRVVSPEGGVPVGVVFTASAPVRDTSFQIADGSKGSVLTRENVAMVRFDGGPRNTGVDFMMPCPIAEFSVRVVGRDGELWPVQNITLGRAQKAVGNPVVIRRQG